MNSHLQWSRAAVGLTILILLAVAPLTASAAPLSGLMKDTGLNCSGPDNNGVYSVQFDGDNAPIVQVHIMVTGEDVFQSAFIFSRVASVEDTRKWDPAVFPWLLDRSANLVRGNFALAGEGKAVIYVDHVPLNGLTGPALRKFISFAAVIVDDAYPKVKNYVK